MTLGGEIQVIPVGGKEYPFLVIGSVDVAGQVNGIFPSSLFILFRIEDVLTPRGKPGVTAHEEQFASVRRGGGRRFPFLAQEFAFHWLGFRPFSFLRMIIRKEDIPSILVAPVKNVAVPAGIYPHDPVIGRRVEGFGQPGSLSVIPAIGRRTVDIFIELIVQGIAL